MDRNNILRDSSSVASKRHTVKPSNRQSAKPPNHRAAKPSNHQTTKPSNHQTSKPSNHQTSKPSNRQTTKPSNHQADIAFMERALELAQRGMGHTRPNPPVGAVVVKDGRIIGEGWHMKAGGDHAEVAALHNALKKIRASRRNDKTIKRSSEKTTDLLSGATVYVTLEPCSRPGRVGACTDALIAAKVSRVVYAIDDPNPKNRGRARRVLAKAGIVCEHLRDKETSERAEAVIAPFAKHVLTGLPYVTVKIAMSLDGRICDDWGNARWVSSDAARKATGKIREKVDAIMVGAETVRRDNPSLLSHGKRNDDLIRVVVSRSGNLPADAQVFTDGAPNKTLVFADAVDAIESLGKMGVTNVLCEGGMKLAVSLTEAGLVDDWVTVLCPKVIGTRPINEATKIRRTMCLQD